MSMTARAITRDPGSPRPKREFQAECCDVGRTRELHPGLQSFSAWVAEHREALAAA